ncbi:unnamed protein product [Spirodela intermedia]|uniref:Uncharacterized protein n=1 Tax=Spirodela intermedia TaxID=51605 RepID=A0A7I8KXU5_SPIIN|nr:unnamed protein product [Spirodela intermedia]
MEDVVTDIPPPSRFFPEDLDNFASPSPALPSPFVLLSDRNPRPRPSLMVVAISPASRLLVHRLSPKSLFGALFLPELPLAGNHIVPSPRDSGCNIYAAGEGILLVSFQYPAAAAERARSVAKALMRDISPQEVLVLDSVRSGSFRGRLSTDDSMEFKLETAAKRAAGSFPALRRVAYYTTGSVAEGVGAALLAECQMRKLKGTLCVAWPGAGEASSPSSSLESLLRDLLPGLRFSADNGVRVSVADSDLYV